TLWKTVGERLPLVPPRAAPIDAQLALGRVVLRVAQDRHDVDRLRLMGMHGDREAEVRGEVAAHLPPALAGVVAPADVPVLLHEERFGTGRVHRDLVDAVSD